MKKINQDQVKKSEEYIKNNCRTLELARIDYLLSGGSNTVVANELRKYQNRDGGFGHGLEPDFLLPLSSPMATTEALQIIEECKIQDEGIVEGAIKYFENTYIEKRHGWFALSSEINNYPHAIWWHWDKQKQQTPIDESWGNPTAEIVGYLNIYKKYISILDLESIIKNVINYWECQKEFKSEHEVYCFLRLHKHLEKKLAKRLEKNLYLAAEKLICLDKNQWNSYVPQPLQFEEFARTGVDENLDFLIDTIDDDGVWRPSWTWHQPQYDTVWLEQKVKWEGIITVRNLNTLKKYGRILDKPE
jgi:hypothetical protein